MPGRHRWLAFGIVTLATALNYLDRQILAALAPQIRDEFALSNADYGLLLAAFSITYALSSPLAGLFIDRVGLNRGLSFSVGIWSLCGVATGLVNGFGALLCARAALGVAESGGIPASGKANAIYLPPKERSLGAALNQVGLSLGAVSAPLVGTWLALAYGWRSAFIVTGLLGFLWIPLWLATARRMPPAGQDATSRFSTAGVLRDSRLWALVAANILAMVLFSLWTNWTTLYLVEERGLTLADANRRFAWMPPVFGNLGGLLGGWLAFRQIHQGIAAQAARIRVCRWAAVVLLATSAIPYMPSATLATAGICLSFFLTLAMSVNIYTLPLDVFGAGHAALATSALTFAFGLMQTVISPVAGALIDRYGFEPLCIGGALMPLAAAGFLRLVERHK
jgi:ACS family hexuronate transporter-like MFS transporter